MSLEDTIHSLSRQMAHRDKRARREERTPESRSPPRTELHPCVTDWRVHTRLTDAAKRALVDVLKVQPPHAPFVAKMAVAAWRALQSHNTADWGVQWVALLIVCCHEATRSFYDVASWASASVDKALFQSLFPILGSAVDHTSEEKPHLQKLVEAVREWSRGDVEGQLAHVHATAKRLRHDPVLDQLVQAVLSPCHRAHFLIKS